MTMRPSMSQSTDQVLIVKPARFYSNPETSIDNRFQNSEKRLSEREIEEQVDREFDGLRRMLMGAGVTAHCFEIDDEEGSPDAIFPNNWFSTHAGGRLVLYPMLSQIRRTERRPEILDFLRDRYSDVLDLTRYEEQGVFLEGTGSLVLDRATHIAYACISARTDRNLLSRWARALGYQTCYFNAYDGGGEPIYHTNVMMAIGTDWAVVSLGSISDESEREKVSASLISSGKTIIDIALDQVPEFCGNVLEVRNSAGERFVVMSTRANGAFTEDQMKIFRRSAGILHCNLELIETLGGGGARCMIAELFAG